MKAKTGPIGWMTAVLRDAAAFLRVIVKARTGPFAWLFYVVVRGAVTLLQMFPLAWNLRTACALARGWSWIMPRHLNRAREHIAAAYRGELSEAEVDRLARRCLECMVMFFVELICLPRLLSPSTWSRYVRLVHFDDALRVLLSGRGAILVTGHYGSFELPGYLLTQLGFDVVGVMRPLDNVYLNEFVVESRRRHGLRLLYKKGATEEAERYLDEGYLLGVIGDQDAGSKGMFVDFFHRPASTYKSIGLLAMARRVPIIVGYARRQGTAVRYDVGVTRIIYPHEWDAQPDPLRWITQTYSEALEEFIREAPEQYLWIHRRWKSEPRVSRRTLAREGKPPSSASAESAAFEGS